jgi:hypothetical protein
MTHMPSAPTGPPYTAQLGGGGGVVVGGGDSTLADVPSSSVGGVAVAAATPLSPLLPCCAAQ